MAFSHTTDFSGTGTGNQVISVTASQGSAIIVCTNNRNAFPTGVSDVAGNTYTLADQNNNTGSANCSIYYAQATTALSAQNVTVAYGAGGFGEAIVMVFGMAAGVTLGLRDHGNLHQTSATPSVSTNGSSTLANDLVCGAFANQTGSITFTAGTGYTGSTTGQISNSSSEIGAEWNITGSGGSQSAGCTRGSSQNTAMVIVSLFEQSGSVFLLPQMAVVYMRGNG